MKIKEVFVISSLIFLICNAVVAQNNDFGTWSGLTIAKNLPAKFDLGINFQLRLNENSTQVKTYFYDINLSRKLNDNFKGFISYRMGGKRQLDGFYLASQRFSFGLSAKIKKEELKFGYRIKLQNSNNNFIASDSHADIGFVVRNKISVKRKIIKKTSMWASYELFTGAFESQLVITDWRWKIGVDRKIKKRQYLSLGFQIQRELINSNPLTDYILFVGYEIELKKRKKRTPTIGIPKIDFK